tara:strand:- start:1277 stop:1642 length:366 start_codon:yes stop_codon:yes gene_type:complete
MISTRRVKTNLKKIDNITDEINCFTSEFSIMLDDQKLQYKKLREISGRISNHIGKIAAYADQKKEPNAYNLYFKSESAKLAKKGQENGGPTFAKLVANSWNNLPPNKKLTWYNKASSSKPY